MWKVKRMNTARIVVLTIAVGAGGIAAYFASGSGNQPLPAEPLRGIADLNAVDTRLDENATRRGGSINVARYGVASLTTAQK
jgi:pilus assembly protein CpaB